MSTFSDFRDIKAWQKARELTNDIYSISKKATFYRDIGLREQIRRAAVSIMSNIAEGFERDGKKEFIQFLSIAKGSCGETRSLLLVALDQQYIDENTFDRLFGLAEDIGKLIGGLMNYLRGSTLTGKKYRITVNAKRETRNT
jgi:four helix bundle protein